jgi:type II secretory ATPase GspE/PulE/Tfp pilus assembly ATPase PilB-like protein
MGVEPFLLPEALIGVLAQRLVRRICDRCKEPVPNPEHVFNRLGVPVPPGPLSLCRGHGCSVCKSSGYRGRIAIFELMMVDDRFHDAITQRAGAQEYSRLAREGGMKTLFDDGLRRAVAGETTLDEVLHVTTFK